MELRRSTREKKVKKYDNFLDDDSEEEVLAKKTKLSFRGAHLKTNALKNGNHDSGKRAYRKRSTSKKDGLENDSDSDFDLDPNELRKMNRGIPRGRKRILPKQKDVTKIEFLLEWKRDMLISPLPTDEKASKVVTVKKIVDANLDKYGGNLQALFINVNWNTTQNKGGIKIDDFKTLDLTRKLIKNGIVFIWSEKEILGRLIKIMEEKGFFYIENFVIALLDASKAETIKSNNKGEKEAKPKVVSNKASETQGNQASDASESASTTESIKKGDDDTETEYFLQNVDRYPNIDGSEILYGGDSEYLKISKRVLMMFRRVDPKETALELRHQRTCDALFDLVDPSQPYGVNDVRTKEYVYKLIETLLPKALYNPEETSLKMMEVWADSTRPREGWINICEK